VDDQQRFPLATDDVENALRRDHVVAIEVLARQTSDLRLAEDHRAGARKCALPLAGLGQVGFDHGDVRMEAAQCRRVRGVLVDRDEPVEASLLQPHDEILPDESCAACDDDLVVCVHVRAEPS